MNRILIAGTGSGCGKTTVVCAFLSALCRRGVAAASFKCGPDYIDPRFHEKAIGISSYNLDSFFCDDDTLCTVLDEYGGRADISVIEGVMGYYDGNADGRGSAYSVSQITNTPAIIVIDCKGMGESIGAVMKGFLSFRENSSIAGFIFNRLPLKLKDTAERLCRELGTEFLGIMPKNSVSFDSRHLGLVTADEITDINEKLDELCELAEKNILIDRIMEISERDMPSFRRTVIPGIKLEKKPVIVVARDNAFCFIYNENIDVLKKAGCEIKYFSPLSDSEIPDDADGIILYGGYPELYAKQLSENRTMLESIRNAAENGMPLIAECGGFMYLHDTVEGADGNIYQMASVIKGCAFRTQKLQRFGYVTLTAAENSMIADKGDTLKAHEFHYWDSTDCGEGFEAVKTNGTSWKCVNVSENLYAGFPHIYYYSCISSVEKFINKCAEYGGKNIEES